jgi:transcriptional regulator with XRE-family HTH domain
MEKSVFTTEYRVLLRLLREIREAAHVTQVQLAEKLGQSQSFVSKCERGERRLDMVQMRTICRLLGTSLAEFVAEFERRLTTKGTKSR